MIKKCLLSFLIIIFLVLAYKNPFNERSLVPNLEPYPDSIFYSYSPWNLIKGNGFGMNLDNIDIRNIVPPSYGIYLLPFLAVFNDIRAFYFANIFLGIASIVFFFFITEKIFKNKVTSFILGTILVTSYYFYSLPQFLMAENMALAVFLIVFWIMLQPVSLKNIIIFTMLNGIFLLIKLSNVPIFASFCLLYFFKVLNEKNQIKLINFILVSVFIYGLSLGEIYLSGILRGREGFAGMVGFSPSYFKTNFNYYLDTLLGSNGRFIWMSEKFVTIDLMVLSLIGVGIGIIKKQKILLIKLAILLISLLIFMGFFYYPDTRYIYLAYPLILIPIGFILNSFGSKKVLGVFLLVFAIGDFGLMSTKTTFEARIITLKKQVGLNFRHAEQPWNYLAVQNFNNYFSKNAGKKYLATFLPVYYVSYFSNGNYHYLPIVKSQEFPEYIAKMCPSGVDKCYQDVLSKGGEIYLSNYYLSNNLTEWGKELDKIKTKYKLTLVNEGCLGTCNIYKLENIKSL